MKELGVVVILVKPMLRAKIKTHRSFPFDPYLISLYTQENFSLNIKAGSHTNGPLLLLHFFSDHFTPSPPLYIRAFLVPSLSHMHTHSFSFSDLHSFSSFIFFYIAKSLSELSERSRISSVSYLTSWQEVEN